MSVTIEHDVIFATFDTKYGAAQALEALQQAVQAGAIEVANCAVVVKDEFGQISLEETGDATGKQGIKKGLLLGGIVGLIFPPSILGAALAGGAVLGLGARMRDAGFKDDDLRAMAAGMPDKSSALIAEIDPKWIADVERTLDAYAAKIGRAVISERVAQLVEEQQSA